jgi:ribosome-associated toxin RatA of RatAB toxin-antitoxin module
MRVAGIVLVGLLIAATGAIAEPQAEPQIQDLPAQEGAAVRAQFFVAAPLSAARTVLWQTEKFPEFMPDTRWAKVYERKENYQVVELAGGKGPITVAYVSERRLYSDRVTWHTLRGDVKVNDGEWRFAPAPGGTELTYEVHLVPKAPVPGFVVSYLQKQALPAMIQAVRRRIEAIARTST